MINKIKPKQEYDLEDRTFEFARNVRTFVKKLPRNMGNVEDSKQALRSSGSVGANYIEANVKNGTDLFFRTDWSCIPGSEQK
jgi:four helix bundle protein